MDCNNIIEKKSDRNLVTDDTMLKTNNISEIYGKLTKYEKATIKYKIKINWKKVAIVVKEKNAELRNFRGILPSKYREINFEKLEPYYGK